MEHNWTYIFQELKLVCTQSKEYSFEESTQLIQAASSEIFLPKAKDLGRKDRKKPIREKFNSL